MTRRLTALAASALLLNALCYGLMWLPFHQLAALGLHPLWATVLVDLLVLAAILVFRAGVLRPVGQSGWLWLLMLAGGMTNVGFNWAVTVGDVVRVVLLFYLMPAWVVILAWPLLGERPTRASLLRVALAVGGVVLVLKTPDSPWPWPQDLADGLALLGGLSFALTNILLRKLRAFPALTLTSAMLAGGALMCSIAAVIGLATGVVSLPPAVAWSWGSVVLVLALMVGVASAALQYGAARLSANATSLIMLCEVVFASGSAVLLGAATMAWATALGGALIMLAALLSALSSGAPTLALEPA
jgi:drug/metabolite transporter (DMT)-like permease